MRTIALHKVKAPAIKANGVPQPLQPVLDVFPDVWLRMSTDTTLSGKEAPEICRRNTGIQHADGCR